MSDMTPDQARFFLDEVHLERLNGCPNVTVSVGSWLCTCEAVVVQTSEERPVHFVECMRCGEGAVVFPWET